MKAQRYALLVTLLASFAALAFLVKALPLISVLDGAVAGAFYSLRNPAATAFFITVTYLADTAVVGAIFAAALLAFLLSRRNKALIVGLIVAIAGAKISEVAIKMLVSRARPDYAFFHLDTFSFPSGHAAAAMAMYGFLAYVFCALYPKRRAAITAAATLVILLIGVSRIYLGVHFLSDVIGGFLLGAIWILVGLRAVRYWKS